MIEQNLNRYCPSVESVLSLDESIGERKIFYRLGESKMFEYANKNTSINGMKLIDVIPLMTLPDHGFVHLGYNDLDPTVQYELFEGSRYKANCKKAMKEMLDSGRVVMVYSTEYKIPTSIPYVVVANGKNSRVFVNISDFVNIDNFGKVKVDQVRNYNALMAALVAACASYSIVAKNLTLPSDVADCIILMYANMMERVINSIVNMDPITRDKVRYLATKFALIQMYGTETGESMFYRYQKSYFPKLSKMITDTLDDQFRLDSFDNLGLFIDGLKEMYPSMRGLSEYLVYDKWIRTYGAATAMSVDYFGYHLYTVCMVLFESPLVSRMALEPIMEKNKGNELYKRLPTLIAL